MRLTPSVAVRRTGAGRGEYPTPAMAVRRRMLARPGSPALHFRHMPVIRLGGRLASCLILSVVASAAAAQARPARDTTLLLRELAAAQDTARVPLLLELAGLRAQQPAEVLRLADEALTQLHGHPAPAFEARARLLRATALEVQGEYPMSLAEAERAESLAMTLHADSLRDAASLAAGRALWRLSRFTPALARAESAVARLATRGPSIALARGYNLIGGIQHSMGKLDAALDRYLAALRLGEELRDEEMIARAHNNIGLVYWDLGRNTDALAALQRALALLERGARPSLTNTLNNIGLVLLELRRPREAIPYLERALVLDRASGDRFGQAKELSNLGGCYKELKQFDRATEYQRQALALREEIGDKDGVARTRGALAELALAAGDTIGAIRMLEQASALARELQSSLDEADQLDTLVRLKTVTGDTAGAFRALERLHALTVALSDSALSRRTAELDAQYQARERERELEAARTEAEERQRDLWFLVAGTIVLATALGLLAMLHARSVRGQRALAESEQRYRALFETSGVPTLLLDTNARQVLDLNAPARVLVGLATRSEPVGVAAVGPDWLRQALDRALQPVSGGHLALEDRWTGPDGQLRWTEIRGSEVALGGRACRLVTLRDATAVRAEEEARQREEKLRSLGVLAGGIAHDFNNALTSILGHVALAKDADPAERAELLDCAEQAAVGASRLTVQLLAFAKGGQPQRRPTDLARLLRDAVALAGAGSHMRVDFELPADLWPGQVDPGQFSQVVSNLVINATQATGEGGRLLITATNVLDSAAGTTDPAGQRFVRIDFRDNGSGIPAAIRDRVFEPYFTTKRGGNGLGLATAFTICQNHGGRLTCASEEGRGTTFSAFLPAAAEAPAAPEAVAAVTPVGGGRILVLEDEPLVQNVLRRTLQQWGYDVEVVPEGRLAVERYLERRRAGAPFDLLIMDLTIPGGMGGRQALAEIHAHDPGARAIVASGYSDDPTMADFGAAGFAAALAKPFLPADLARVLARVQAGAPRPG